MSEPFVYDSLCLLCKQPFGAVSCGTSILFRVRPLATEGFSLCFLLVKSDFSGRLQKIPMTCDGAEAERIRFSLTFSAPDAPDLLWYAFCFLRPDGSGCSLDRGGYRQDGPVEFWQLTVYEKSHTPQWFCRGINYQIFPDRYCRLAPPDACGLIGNRRIHSDWYEAPDWQPDPDGEIRNRDFFGGTLTGIAAHLDELSEMGVTTLYLNPIFESASNHRYNTADYLAVDPMLGTAEDFQTLCAEGRKRGIRIILDGVFNHTGSQSRYFNADGRYPDLGAAQSKESPYADWYSFSRWPDQYDAWWGFPTLPAVREDSPGYRAFIAGENGVIRHWLRLGASGWRLDVADELPDDFLSLIRTAVEETDRDAILLGEVWEDASNKIAYSQRRRYLLGRELHSVMNYPFRSALIDYLLGGDADRFRFQMETLRENYPLDAFAAAMIFLSTHDTPRILTVLGADSCPESRAARAAFRLSDEARRLGLERVRLAATVLFTFPGVPTVYYGDEVGMEGWEDPFNRGPYPWGRGDLALKAHFAALGRLRRREPALTQGELVWRYTAGPLLLYQRVFGESGVLIAVNAGNQPLPIPIPLSPLPEADLLGRPVPLLPEGRPVLPPRSGLLFPVSCKSE